MREEDEMQVSCMPLEKMEIFLDGDVEEINTQIHQTLEKTNKEFHDAQEGSEQKP